MNHVVCNAVTGAAPPEDELQKKTNQATPEIIKQKTNPSAGRIKYLGLTAHDQRTPTLGLNSTPL